MLWASQMHQVGNCGKQDAYVVWSLMLLSRVALGLICHLHIAFEKMPLVRRLLEQSHNWKLNLLGLVWR